jgi:hypothetical protein
MVPGTDLSQGQKKGNRAEYPRPAVHLRLAESNESGTFRYYLIRHLALLPEDFQH